MRAHVERHYATTRPEGALALGEYVACSRAIWDSWQHRTPPAFEGRHFRLTVTDPEFMPEPLTGDRWRIPV